MKKILFYIFAISLILKGEIVLEAIGYGDSVLDSQDSAIKELSGVIISNVDSKFIKKEVIKDGAVNKATSRFIAVTSKTILKGVGYISMKKDGKEFVSKAILTRKALNGTVKYLKNLINIQGYKLNRKELREKLELITLLKPLLTLSSESTYFADKKEREFLGYLNQAQIQFHLVPKDAVIKISGKIFTSFESIFLSGGKYLYQISKDGYFAENGYMRVSNGEKLIKNITLIKKDSNEKTISLDIYNRKYQELFEEYLPNYGISISDSKKFKLKVQVSKRFVTKIEGYKFYNLTVEAKLYKNGKIFKTKRAKMRNKTLNIINRKSPKLVKALIKHLFGDNEIKRYFQ